MDPLGILTSVVSTASFLIGWMEARDTQERTVKDIHTTIRDIHQSILLSLLDKSKNKALDHRISGPLETLHDVLRRTQDHLVGWEQSRSRKMPKLWTTINPWAILEKLKADERKLMISMQILATAMVAISITVPIQEQALGGTEVLDISVNSDVRKFWASEVGEEISYCSAEHLVLALRRHLKIELKAGAGDVLSLRLDEYGAGHVTLANFDTFVGSRSLSEALREIGVVVEEEPSKASGSVQGLQPARSTNPILILVDDRWGYKAEALRNARSTGVVTYRFTSIAAAKAWIDGNEDMLRQADSANQLRVVSDNACREQDASLSRDSFYRPVNLRAGEAILRYLRGRQYNAPVLIYADYSISETNYVLQYSNAGSTGFQEVLEDFVRPLSGKTDDGWWCDFDVHPKSLVMPTVIWVDDNMSNNQFLIDYGNSLGLNIITIESTEAAQRQIASNERKCFRFPTPTDY
ncbi:hypothetical protein V5O48_001782 [Marasmius crinis-equi]|uniref:Uncharacterized protein n=1 Tax=Marasmius crinis-equi TaxID=585013 RepID=A0ABR3FXG2_9AGAR